MPSPMSASRNGFTAGRTGDVPKLRWERAACGRKRGRRRRRRRERISVRGGAIEIVVVVVVVEIEVEWWRRR